MSKIANAFKDGKAFIGFLTAGDPTIEKTVEYIFNYKFQRNSINEDIVNDKGVI